MKFNKWTLGLAAVGAISLVPTARADEKQSALGTAFNNTTISGYVSASMNWAIAPGGGQNGYSPANYIPFQTGKQDGFNLDVVKIAISKPEDESPWASGYDIELMFGPDATGYNPSVNGNNSYYSYYYGNNSDFSIKQAYVTLRTPVGNGIDWKIGVFDTVIGYEVTDAGSNPNYTRSIGYAVEPTEHTGFLATYKINDQWSVSAGVANTLSAGINSRDMESGYHSNYYNGGAGSDWKKTLLGSIVYTAPMSWGWAAGSSIYVGAVYGFVNSPVGSSSHYGAQSGYQQNYYFGATVNTPWKQLTTGVAFDYVRNSGGGDESGSAFDNFQDITDTYVIGLYVTYKATDKLSINGRAEYVNTHFTQSASNTSEEFAFESSNDAEEITATVEYDLWANVVSRVELRYDHDNSYRGDGDHEDALGFYANVIYKW
jgi:hypothetical protein